MDFFNNMNGDNQQQNPQDPNMQQGNQQMQQGQQMQQPDQASNEGGGFMGMVNNAAGGGQQGEKNEEMLDKGLDYIQEKYMGAGDQGNETAAEQMKDEAITDAIRKQYKTYAGSDFPIADK